MIIEIYSLTKNNNLRVSKLGGHKIWGAVSVIINQRKRGMFVETSYLLLSVSII